VIFLNWRKEYKNKLLSPIEAVSNIKSGERIVLGHCAAVPKTLVKALVDNKEQYQDLEIVHMLSLSDSSYTEEGMEKYFRHNALFVGGNTRRAIDTNRAEYTPVFFHEVPELFRDGTLPVDTALIQVSKPDKNGFCSLGVSVDYTKGAAENAKVLIAEINDKMPRTLGDSFIHVSDIDYLVESSYDIPELQPPNISEIEKKIGEYCASLIENGSTLQLGIGAIPDAVLLFLKDKKDLGIHSEMISDGIVELVEEGVITNKKKNINRGKAVVTFLMGTKRLYDFIDDNPSIEFYPVDYVNNPAVIMKLENMVAINSCLAVDLMGQIAADSMGLKQYSGVGGQVDFVRGSAMGRGGKAIIAIPSTAGKGKYSRIVPFLEQGTAVTTSRNDVHYVVTEYGIANLKGRTLKERGRALINIAHPNFREELIKEWQKRFDDKF